MLVFVRRPSDRDGDRITPSRCGPSQRLLDAVIFRNQDSQLDIVGVIEPLLVAPCRQGNDFDILEFPQLSGKHIPDLLLGRIHSQPHPQPLAYRSPGLLLRLAECRLPRDEKQNHRRLHGIHLAYRIEHLAAGQFPTVTARPN